MRSSLDDDDKPRPFQADSPKFLARVHQCLADMRSGEMTDYELQCKHGGLVILRAREMLSEEEKWKLGCNAAKDSHKPVKMQK